jgi:glycosyltransferase involved in cell wall biosynthesis
MNSRTLPLVSIVTPVYQAAEYLEECLESLLAQTYRNWECTVVDNCSTDGSLGLARRYAANDDRIRVHENTTFLRAVPNYNNALRQISPASKYCKVVFSDDWIFPECLERMVGVAEAHPSVGLVGAYCLEGDHVICTGLPYSESVLTGRDACRRHLLDRLYLFGSANSILYRSDLVRARDPFYNEANIHSDTEVCFEILKNNDFGFVHQVLTFTRLRPGSLNTVSADLHSDLAGMLQVIIGYGPYYLSKDEFDAFLDHHLSEYYGFLAKCLALGRGKRFWDYHRSQLANAGFAFSRRRLVRATLAHLYKSPREALAKLSRVRMTRQSSNI